MSQVSTLTLHKPNQVSTQVIPALCELPGSEAQRIDDICEKYEKDWRRHLHLGVDAPDPNAYLELVDPSWQETLRVELECARDHLLGPKIPGFEIHGEIGRGGMGVVYRGHRISDGKWVAIKEAGKGEEARIHRLEWLVGELGQIQEPHFVPMREIIRHEGKIFLVMPFIAGADLSDPEENHKYSQPTKAVELLKKLAGAVLFFHQRGFIHRDLKPANILIDLQGEPHICDFGLIRILEETLDINTIGAGTFFYMSPEQMARTHVTTLSDIWSLGAILYELLQGLPPFVEMEGDQPKLSKRKLSDDFPEFSQELEREQPDLCYILNKCLHHEDKQRYQSAAELLKDLEKYLDGKRVRPRVSLEEVIQEINTWWKDVPKPLPLVMRWVWVDASFGLLFLLFQGIIFLLVRQQVSALWIWGVFLTHMGLDWFFFMWLLFWNRRRLNQLEKQMVHIWIGWTIGYLFLMAAYCPPLPSTPASAVLPFYPAFSVLTGLVFLSEGTMFWRRMYFLSLGYFVLPPFLTLSGDFAPLVFGVFNAVMMAILSISHWRKGIKQVNESMGQSEQTCIYNPS